MVVLVGAEPDKHRSQATSHGPWSFGEVFRVSASFTVDFGQVLAT